MTRVPEPGTVAGNLQRVEAAQRAAENQVVVVGLRIPFGDLLVLGFKLFVLSIFFGILFAVGTAMLTAIWSGATKEGSTAPKEAETPRRSP